MLTTSELCISLPGPYLAFPINVKHCEGLGSVCPQLPQNRPWHNHLKATSVPASITTHRTTNNRSRHASTSLSLTSRAALLSREAKVHEPTAHVRDALLSIDLPLPFSTRPPASPKSSFHQSPLVACSTYGHKFALLRLPPSLPPAFLRQVSPEGRAHSWS